MPPKSRFRNKKNKNNSSPYQHPNVSSNPNYSHPNHPASNTHQKNHHNRGRSSSRARSNRSHSRKPFRHQRPSTPKPKCFQPQPTNPHTPPSSPDHSLASKATHTLRSTLLSSPTGILKRRISLSLSLTLPSSAASARIKSLLLHAIDDARGAMGRMDFDLSSSTPQNMAVDVDVCPGAPNGKGPPRVGWGGEEDEVGFRDSEIGMAMDTDAEKDVWETDETSVLEGVDHGCVDVVEEHGQYVQRMRWEATDPPAFASEPPTGSRGQRKTSGWGGKGHGRFRSQSSAFGAARDDVWGDEVM